MPWQNLAVTTGGRTGSAPVEVDELRGEAAAVLQGAQDGGAGGAVASDGVCDDVRVGHHCAVPAAGADDEACKGAMVHRTVGVGKARLCSA